MRLRVAAVLAVLTFLVGAVGAAPASAATTLVVDDDGQAAVGNCDAPDSASSTIQAGVDAAEPGDTVVVCPGTYQEEVQIDKTLSLLGAKAGVPGRRRATATGESVLDSVNAGGGTALSVTAENVVISGFWIDDWLWGLDAAATATALRVQDTVFLNNLFGAAVRSPGSAIVRSAFRGGAEGIFQDGSNGAIANNEFTQVLEGVTAQSVENVRIRNNTFAGSEATAVRAVFTTALRVAGNVVTEGGYGVWLNYGNDAAVIEDNEMSLNAVGILVGDENVTGPSAEQYHQGTITVRRNEITGNGTGMLLERFVELRQPVLAQDNVIAGNDQAGIDNESPLQANAARNWWGAASGPSDWSIGTGDAVSDNVRFFPWATNEAINAFAQCTQSGTAGPDTLIGTAGSDILCGLHGEDRLEGRGGADLLLGEEGNDLLLGGGGDDAILGGQSNDNLRGNAGFDSLQGQANTDTCLPGPDGGQVSTCE